MQGDPFGVSFSPLDGPSVPGQKPGGQKPTPVQQAIQTLSLRIPRNAGAGAFAPQALLDSQGGGAIGGGGDANNTLEMIKRLLFGRNGQPGQIGTGPELPRSPDQSQPPPSATPWAPTPWAPTPSDPGPGPGPSFAPPMPSPMPPPMPTSPWVAPPPPMLTPNFVPGDNPGERAPENQMPIPASTPPPMVNERGGRAPGRGFNREPN